MISSLGFFQFEQRSNQPETLPETKATPNAADLKKQLNTLTPSDSMTDARSVTEEEEDVPMVLIQEIPKLKYHEEPLHFMSEPGITQEQYEHMILSGAKNPAEDEYITIKCPDASDGTGQVFEVKKSTLTRSPTFARFCESDNFLPGCHMLFTFITDPAICFKIVIYYLEEGPDRYNKAKLGVLLRTHFKQIDRFILLGRLYFLAMRLELPGLFDMCYAILEEYQHDMTAGYCITMASLIFSRGATYDKRMKEWCMKYIKNYALHLSQICVWREIVPMLDAELQHHWARLVEKNKRVIAAMDEERTGTAEAETVSLSSVEDQRRMTARIEGHLNEMKVEEVIEEALGEQAESDQEWEDVESLLKEDALVPASLDPHRTASNLSDDKANSVLGLSPSKKKIDAIVEWHNARLKPGGKGKEDIPWVEAGGSLGSPEAAKARAVMGINTLPGKLAGHKKRRFSRKVYNILRS